MAQNRPTLSVVINTKNSAQTLDSCLKSVHSWADEIVVMDMKSTDDTLRIAKFYGARTFSHPDVGYVEPARNAALAKARGEWILILDSDETIPGTLATRITKELILHPSTDAYFLPRKNMVFHKWVHTGWWPDYQLRLFRSGKVQWSDQIHSVPKVRGTVERLDASESLAIRHDNYTSVPQFWSRALNYGKIRSQEFAKTKQGSQDPLAAFMDEYIRRYYSWKGYTDGTHGRVLSALQASTAVLEQALLWETRKFKETSYRHTPLQTLRSATAQANFWEWTRRIEATPFPISILYKIARALRLNA